MLRNRLPCIPTRVVITWNNLLPSRKGIRQTGSIEGNREKVSLRLIVEALPDVAAHNEGRVVDNGLRASEYANRFE